MKKLMCSFCFILGLSHYQAVQALDGAGTVEEVMICTGFDHVVDGVWSKLGLFRLSDGNWFGAYVNYTGPTLTESDDSSIYSTAMLAFSSDAAVTVRANYRNYTACGIEAAFLWSTNGDFIRVSK